MDKYSIDYLLSKILDTKKHYVTYHQERPLYFYYY